MSGPIVFRPKERVIILSEHTLDYEIEDLDTGATYLIDKTYFNRKYEAEGQKKEIDN